MSSCYLTDDIDSTINDMDDTQSLKTAAYFSDPHQFFSDEYIESAQEECEFPVVKPPKILNGYLFGGVIGEGSFGKVKEVIDENTLVRRAVKIVSHFSVKKIPNGIASLEREMRVMGRLKHRNVVKLVETFRIIEKRKTYIIMEFCFGTVEQLVESSIKKYLTEPDAHYLFVQLIDGLEYLHSHGIIHNDIKPTNLLLSSDFVLKICDFGVSEELPICKADDLIYSDRGTPSFKPPEVINGDAHEFSGFKIDIFAAGVTLFYMACGRLPWDVPPDVHLITIFKKICEEEYELPEDIVFSKEFKELLTKLLQKNPAERASIDQIKNLEWFRISFNEEYSRFKVESFEKFYPKSCIKPKLEQLYAEPLHFSYYDDKSDTDDWQLQCTRSEPDLSPIKKLCEPIKQITPRSKSHAPRRRPTFLKWLRNVRRN